ncbi:serine/threonine-protein kinase [Actinoplanes sp. TFC3]|uniref:serine/threonine-protein kinase n=1 Tax=Actinoplanes sp. TFC3 TaxID=1710355 RepID=UPI003512A181
MGTVYLGRARDGRRVAIKVIRQDLSWDDELRGRFRSEVNRVRQVPSFSTAAVLDADPDHDPPYLVVEYVDGPSLATVVRERGPLSSDALHSMAIGISTALVAIHGAGVIHRDLKPGNVLFALGGVKVIDFGIARPLEVTSQHTRTDQMVGTVAYMAPERFDTDSAGPVTPAADIFAWGVVVMFAATGRTPFGAESAPATAMRILTQEPDLTGLTAPLRTLVASALATSVRNGAVSPVRSGSWVRMRIAVAGADSAPNGVRPVAANITTTPHAKMSAAGVTGPAESVSKRSGAM